MRAKLSNAARLNLPVVFPGRRYLEIMAEESTGLDADLVTVSTMKMQINCLIESFFTGV